MNLQDEKACFSRVGRACKHDYSVIFSDLQNLQLLRTKLLRIASTIDSFLTVIQGCKNHCRRLDELKLVPLDEQVIAGFELYERETKGHQRSIGRIIDQSQGTGDLVCILLNCALF